MAQKCSFPSDQYAGQGDRCQNNAQLTTTFCREEFKEAMFSIQPDKCSGPDSFNPGFYQTLFVSIQL
ncbi:hypothetical protein MTR_0100s0120 [Medicago truncatula]|uniref:Uncharacterized protein n=1 Tax=Medicago truncatula TaxID=3880 RepID=A0A072TT71_MEDTR|nr:hypothetical protein MTR_0100s0120 [Medicago truncatula]